MTRTLPEVLSIREDFPPVDYEQWRALVEESLAGAPFEKKLVTQTYDGIPLQPIYTRRDQIGDGDPGGFPGLPPMVRGSQPLGAAQAGWDLRQEFAEPDLEAANRAILDDVAGGVTSLQLCFDRAASNGFDPDHERAVDSAGHFGVMVYCVDDLERLLAGVPLDRVPVAIDAGAAFLPAAAILVGLWQRRRIAPTAARGAFNADPLAVLARDGKLPMPAADAIAAAAELARWTARHYPHVTAVGVNTLPYHDAGATAAQDIALAAATSVQYLRAMVAAGMSIDDAASQIVFRLGLGTHHFKAIAKLRAARQVWSRIIEACGGTARAGAMKIHARTADRVLTQYDPYVNLLRNTVAVFAAGVGGAETITSVPLDAMTGLPDSFSRRVARNTVLVLQEEAHLHRVIDPAGGSWFLDRLSAELAEKAWQLFQDSERQGGMESALRSGWVAAQIDAAHQPRARDIARRKAGITGVSEFPDIHQPRVVHAPPDAAALRGAAVKRIRAARRADHSCQALATAADRVAAAVDAAAAGATLGQIATSLGFWKQASESIAPLPARNFARPFEQLRQACDTWQAVHGQRPRAFLANLGPLAHHSARATWSKNFLEAGGFEVIGNAGFATAEAAAGAFAESGASVAVICSSDKLYPEFVPQAAAGLRAAGARTIVLAGHPGDNEQSWRAAGVDRFIFLKCDVLQTLRELLREQGVIKDGEPSE